MQIQSIHNWSNRVIMENFFPETEVYYLEAKVYYYNTNPFYTESFILDYYF